MNFQEKIYSCRKKAGLSQEELAAKVGVSRQAVSKWETGEADPELAKLKKLAAIFRVSIDWLLSDDPEPEEKFRDPGPEPASSETKSSETREWLEQVPDFIAAMFKRFGWAFGLYAAGLGAVFSLIGGVLRVLVRRMYAGAGGIGIHSGISMSPGLPKAVEKEVLNEIGGAPFPGPGSAGSNPVYIAASVLLFAGILLLIAGIIMSIWLYKKSKEDSRG